MKPYSPRVDLATICNWAQLTANAHYHAPTLVESLAKRFRVSERTVERAFETQLHAPPQRWTDRIRLAQAEKLARNPGIRTKEIAFILEYKKVSHFCRQWRHF